MVAVDKLRGAIAEQGYSQRQVAKCIGLAEKTFYTKMKTGSFEIEEAQKMVELLNINDPAAIFFAK